MSTAVPGQAEAQAYYRRMAEKLGMDPQVQRMAGAATAMYGDALKEAAAKMKDMKGYPVRSTLTITMGAVLSPDARTLYVSNGRGRSVSVIDVATRTLARTIPDVGVRPWGIGVSADGRTVYTANGPGGDVSIVDAGSGPGHARLRAAGRPGR